MKHKTDEELTDYKLEADSDMLDAVTKEDYACFITIIEKSDLCIQDKMALEALFNKQIVSMYKLGFVNGCRNDKV